MIGGKLFMWVGDATGHGVPAALLTSAARSAAAIIEKLPDVTPGIAMTFLNNAIHQSSKGKMMMTFFIASIDPKNGELVYSNASHDPPFLMRNTMGKLTKKDLEPLNEVNNPRLGELAHHDYSETKLTIAPQDAVFFYTDGVPDVRNKEGVAWGQKNFVKSITSNVSGGADVQKAVEQIREQVMAYRDNSELPDDVTFILCKYQKET
jgi:sigma-B regulation protein RsbU (phosphoserine phosphatase)